jgi:uncharacterized protein (TIGR01777 family)
MKVAVSGASGLVGSALIPYLAESGHEVVRLVRAEARKPDELRWDPERALLEESQWEGVGAVCHLAGENIASRRWTPEQMERIRRSRVVGTRNLCLALARLRKPPSVFLCASAVGYYGDRGAEWLDEASSRGRDFLADVCSAWEAASEPLEGTSARIAHMRFGLVLSGEGGALAKMLPPFRLGVAGKVGSGEQYMSWIGLDDLVAAVAHVLATEGLKGPINFVAPEPVTNATFTKALGRVLHRPTVMPMPAFAARLAFGKMADSLLLAGQRVRPAVLQGSGFRFLHPEIEGALAHALGK